MDEREILLKEYETLREESMSSINNRSQIVAFGLATIGGLFAGTFVVGKPSDFPLLTITVLNFGIPTVSILVLYIWLGELECMMRAGFYLIKLEKRINEMSSQDLLGWEGWLRSSGTQMRYPYLVVIALFLFFVFASPLVGFTASGIPWKETWWGWFFPWAFGFFVFVHIIIRSRKYK